MEAIKYENGKMTAHITRHNDLGYRVYVIYDDNGLFAHWYTRLSSAKRGLKRVLDDLASSAENINYERAMKEGKKRCELWNNFD